MNTPNPGRRRILAFLTAGLVTLGGAAAVVLPSTAQDAQPDPITVELLTPRSEFTDDVDARLKVKLDGQQTAVLDMRDPSLVATAKITVQPGAQFPWHTHLGPVIVNVAQGELIYVNAGDCVERPYPAGTLFVDPGRGNVHTAFNPTDGVTVVYATLFEAPAQGPLTLPVDAPADCDVEVGGHAH